MSFSPYPAYKDSGVEWLGEVPNDWEVLTLRRAVDAVKTGGTPSEEPPESDIFGGVPWYTPGDFDGGLLLTESAKFVSKNSVTNGDAKTFPSGAVLVVSIGATIGKVGYLSAPASANQQINVVIPNSKVDGYFLAYSLSVKSDEMLYLSNASTIGIINQEKTKELWLALPPIPEQLMIASFLDHETARIDALIEEQQRLIELLKEKRQAVISHAVTKGLNPTVPMQESGVEWLGEVPAHWEVLRMGAVYTEAADKGLTELPVLRVSIHYGVSDKELSEEESDRKITRIDDREKYKRVRPGDLVYNMMRAWQGGFGAVLVDGLVSPAYVVARPKNGNISRYVEQLLRTSCAVEEMRRNSYGITDFRLRLYWDQFKKISLAIPPEFERQQIMERIDSLISESDALKNVADRLIEILQERRCALISAAVTGKIDVRGWRPPARAHAAVADEEAV
jgi:type I restriction enzyme S subunit